MLYLIWSYAKYEIMVQNQMINYIPNMTEFLRDFPPAFPGFSRFFSVFPGFLRFYMVFDGFSSHGCFLAKLTKYFDPVDQPDFPGFCTGFRFFHFNIVPYMKLWCRTRWWIIFPTWPYFPRFSPGFSPVFSGFLGFYSFFDGFSNHGCFLAKLTNILIRLNQ